MKIVQKCLGLILWGVIGVSSAAEAPYSELLLWDVDSEQRKSLPLEITSPGCLPIPALTAGKLYQLEINNPLDKEAEVPVPDLFMDAMVPLSVHFSGMILRLKSFSGISLNPGAKITVEIVPITPGRWSSPCQEGREDLVINAAQRPFPSPQPEGGIVPGMLRLPQPLAPFTLHNQHEAPLEKSDFKDRWQLLFFGYTFCPDICPTGMLTMTRTYKMLPKKIRNTMDVRFISVDPGRDTPKALREFLSHFHPEFSAASGSEESLRNFSEQLSADYYLARDRSDPYYSVAHTADFFIIDPKGRLVARLAHDTPAKQLTLDIEAIWNYAELLDSSR